MKTLLCVMSYGNAKPIVDMLWPDYTLPGWPIVGVTPEDDIHTWHPSIIHCAAIAKSCYLCPDLIKRFVACFEMFLREPKFEEFTDFCLIEYDSMFLRLPQQHPSGLFTHLAGGTVGTLATRFFHPPWWADRETAAIIVEEGKKLMADGIWEAGSPDVFLGLICDRRPEIKIHETHTWSCNGNDLQNRWPEAEAVVRKPKCFYAHGIRTLNERNRLKSLV